MLRVESLHAGYGKSRVLGGLDLEAAAGRVTSLLGRNGAGKTTTLRAIMGLTPPESGRIWLDGAEIHGLAPDAIARLGVALVPENRGIFASLSVEENLSVAARRGSAWPLARIYERFPLLARSRNGSAAHLSGGERQILAIARALAGGPRLLMIDEASQGLAPAMVAELAKVLADIKDEGVAVLLVDQNLALCLDLAEQHYVIDQGRIVHHGDRQAFLADPTIRERYLALSE